MLWLMGCSSLKSNIVESNQIEMNVVMIVVDTLRYDHVGVYGAKNPTTPNLDGFANQGVIFDRAYAQSGWTLPSTVTMFTGLYPHEHKVGRAAQNATEFGSLPPSATTMAEIFQQSGYATGAVINNTFLAPEFGLHQGFADYFYQGADTRDLRSAKETTDQAIQWWQTRQEPKFLVVHYMEPHMDLDPPDTAKGRFVKNHQEHFPFAIQTGQKMTEQPKDKRDSALIQSILDAYDEEILAVDMELGRLVQTLGTENTMYVFTSDHGEEFWEFDGFEHGHHLKGVLTHVPLIFFGAGISQIGHQSSLVSHLDMFHSILEHNQLSIPEESHGRNILTAEFAEDSISENTMVLSENILYGEAMLSVVSAQYRLEINQISKMAVLWRLNEKGEEIEVVQEDLDMLSRPFFRYIGHVRGGVDLVEQSDDLKVPSIEAFQNLKKLGYIDEEK